MIEALEDLKPWIGAAGTGALAALIAWLRAKKLDKAKVDSLIVENIKSLMEDHNNLYQRVIMELDAAKAAKTILEDQYREEIQKGIIRDQTISKLEHEIMVLKEEILRLKGE